MEKFSLTVRSVRTERIPPDPKGAAQGMQRIGYTLEEAVADLVDNSIDASARKVLVRFFRNTQAITQVAIVDDGSGMDEETLRQAMQYGVQTHHKPSDLGKYGIGLKTASLSQCQSVSVVSRRKSIASGRRWTLTRMQDDWRCDVIDPADCATILDQPWDDLDLSEQGTIVLWDDLDALSTNNGDVNKLISRIITKKLPVDLGIRFHRFLESGLVEIVCDVFHREQSAIVPVKVLPLNPFAYTRSGKEGYPLNFRLEFPGNRFLNMVAHIWPPKSDIPEYRLGGGRVAERQGFYFYRNDRLIQVGGWNGVRESDAEPHFSLARVSIDLPPSLDAAFNLLIQKSKVVPPPSFKTLVENVYAGKTRFVDYIAAADETYRAITTPMQSDVVVPGKGLPLALQRRIAKIVSDDGTSARREIRFEWIEFAGDEFFRPDASNDVIYLNLRYRPLLVEKGTHSSSDIPLVKSLLFLLLSPDLQQLRLSKKRTDWHDQCNEILTAALRAMQ